MRGRTLLVPQTCRARLGNLPSGSSPTAMELSQTITCRDHWRQRTPLKTHHCISGWLHATIQERLRTALVEAYWCFCYQILLCRVRYLLERPLGALKLTAQRSFSLSAAPPPPQTPRIVFKSFLWGHPRLKDL